VADFADVRDFLAAPRCAVLSSLDSSGAPHQTVVHYFCEPDGLVVNGRPDRLWVKHLRRDPRVSLVVHDADDYLHWVGIKGTARVVHEGREATQAAMDLARRYDENPEDFAHLERVSFAIDPRRVFESRD
jgi:PPOX class probable F420-dependent enzyme